MVKESEKPDVGFRFEEGTKGVICLPFQKAPHGTGGGVGDPAHNGTGFGGIKPQIRLGPQLFVPGTQKPVIVLLGGKSLIVGSRQSQLKDNIGGNITIGDRLVLCISHTGHETGDLVFLQFFGKTGKIVPHEIADFLFVAPGKNLFALFAMAGRHPVVGHQIEKRLAVGESPGNSAVPVLNAPAGSRFAGQEGNGILIDLIFKIHIAEAEVSQIVVRVPHLDLGVPPSAVFVESKVLRVGLAETLNKPQIAETVAVGDVQGTGAELEV